MPPILFDSGYSLNQKDFFRNFTSIVLFATVGTVISAVTIGMSLFALAEHGYIASLNAESPKEALLFGALLSATDPVATLAVLGQLRVEPQIHSIIFGESVLNDAVAIVLFQTINNLPATTRFHISGADAVEAMANFVGVAVGSVMLGTAIGLLTAFVTKRLLLQASVPTEVNVMMCMAYLAFISADEFGLSGLMAVFFSGCVMSHYAKYNLSPLGQQATHHLASTVANLAEQLTFMYFGFMILPMISPSCSEAEHLQQVFQVHWGFVGYTILLCLGSRALHILPLTLLVNFLEGRGPGAREERRDTRISMPSACFIWFSGLRGAIAFALSLSLASENRRLLIPCVVMVVLFTNIVLGQCTVPMLQLLNIRRGVVGIGTESDDEDGMVPSPERAGGSGRGTQLVSLSARERSRVRLHRAEGSRSGRGDAGGRIGQLWRRIDEMYIKPIVGGRKRTGWGPRVPRQREEARESRRGVYVLQVDREDEVVAAGRESAGPEIKMVFNDRQENGGAHAETAAALVAPPLSTPVSRPESTGAFLNHHGAGVDDIGGQTGCGVLESPARSGLVSLEAEVPPLRGAASGPGAGGLPDFLYSTNVAGQASE